MNPPFPPTSIRNPSSFTFLPPNPNPNPNPNANSYFFHPQHNHHHLPSSITTVTPPAPPPPPPPPPPPDLPSILSTLKDLIQLSETTILSFPTLLRTNSTTTVASSDDLCTCPFNTHHRVPPESLFLHSLRCPSSPATIDLRLLESLHYPNTLQSYDALIKQNRFIQTLHDPGTTELCLSLEEFGDIGSNFFYRDCPGVVTLADQDGTNRTLTLPGALSAECANFTGTGDGEVKGFSTDCLRILPSELWLVRSETEAWNDYPTSYSYSVLRAILCLRMCKRRGLLRWIIVNSPRYGVLIDVSMRDHIFLLFRLCLKAIGREAMGSADSLFYRELKELSLKTTSFNCPILAQALMWLATQFAVLYGELNGKLFAVDMLKHCLSNDPLNSIMFSGVQKGTGSPPTLEEVGSKLEEPLESRENEREMILVSQVAAAVAALHERSLLEGKIKAIWYSRQLASFQRMTEHAYVSKRADEERQKRSNYRPILEHDGLLWQRARNQETNKMKSREELLAEERDYKRRRMSYRGKKMKRTTTQVTRDIIEEYMEEIKQAGGFGCLLNEAEEAGMLASGPSYVHDISTDNELERSVPNSSEVSREQPHGYKKQLPYHNNIKSIRFEDESPEDEKRHRRDSHRHHGHLEEQISNRNRHVREYYSRSPDGQRSNGRSFEQIVNQGLQDDVEVSIKYLPRSSDRSHSRSQEQTSHRRDRFDQYVEDKDRRRSSDRINRGMQDDTEVSRKYLTRSPDRSHSRSHERTSHRRDRVDQYVEDKNRRRRNTHRNHIPDSVTRHEFEDRYDPSEP